MELTPVVGAAAAFSSLLVLWWAVSGERAPSAAPNLVAGFRPPGDLRQAVLDRSASERAVGPAARRLAARARKLTPAGMVDGLERRVLLAGGPAAWPLERVLAAKLALGSAGLVFGLFRFLHAPGAVSLLVNIGIGVGAYLVADLVLYGRADKRQKQIRLDMPDTFDQITIAVDAGLGFEAAMARTARTGTGPLAEELMRVLQDIQAGMSRAQALRALVDRTDVGELRHFVAAVLQAEEYGIAIGQVLRVQATELRVKRRQRAEERALKLPVKVIFPLILCILPTIFIIVIGPGVIQISRTSFGGG